MSSKILTSSVLRIPFTIQFIRQNKSFCHHPRIALFSTEITEDKSSVIGEKKIGGFAKAFQKYTNIPEDAEAPEEVKSFATMLRSSKFIDLGDPQGKIVTGEIFQVVNDDLYIDFGWKFYCVCTKPLKNGDEYVRGAKVRLLINDLELSSRFLGSDTDLTLLEADCKLLNLIYSPAKR